MTETFVSQQEELEALIAEQAYDDRHSDRIWSNHLSLDSPTDVGDGELALVDLITNDRSLGTKPYVAKLRQRPSEDDPRHGTEYGYKLCRCERCRQAATDARRNRKNREGDEWAAQFDKPPEHIVCLPTLNRSELETIHLLSLGASRDEIAEVTGYSFETVKSAIRDAKKKTGAKTTPHLVALALRLRLI